VWVLLAAPACPNIIEGDGCMKQIRMSLLFCLALAGPAYLAHSAMTVGTNLWRTDVDYFQSGVNWATTTNPWNPVFLAECAPYSVIRQMDWCCPMMTAGCNNPGVWSTRMKKTDPPTLYQVAYEWMIDLSNRLNKDIWVNLPTLSDTTYAYNLAQLIHAQLNSNLRVYVEYTNEHWNYDASWFQTQGTSLGMPGSDAAWRGTSYYTYRAVQVWEQFEKVFGKDSPRIIKTLCGQASNVSVAGHEFAALADTVKVNPHKVKANAMGIAPYMRGADVNGCRAELGSKYQEARGHATLCSRAGVQFVCYESSFETTSGSVIAADPAVYQLCLDYLDTLRAGGVNGPMCWYTCVGTPAGYQWGAKAYTGQPLAEAHKYRAILDWVNAHPVSVVDKPRLSVMSDMAATGSAGWSVDLMGRRLPAVTALGQRLQAMGTCWVMDKNGLHLRGLQQ
jgi:hypothetical protein